MSEHQSVENNQAITNSNTTTTEEEPNNETTTTTPTVSSTGAPPKRKLTEEEKREILRRRRLEKIKGNSESRMNKLLYGDSVTTTETSATTTSTPPPSESSEVVKPESSATTEDTPTIADKPPIPEKEVHSHPSPIEALTSLINQKVEEAYSPLFKLHDPKLIEKETREYEQPMPLLTNIASSSTTGEEPQTAATLNLTKWDKEATVKTKSGFFEKLRPLFILILAFICAISSIYHNEKLHFGAAGLDTLLEYFGKFTPVTMLITFELALILPGLMSGKSIFSMHTESALDMFLFMKSIWVSVDRFISDIVLFLFVYIVTSTLSNNLHSNLIQPHQQTTIEELQQQIEQLLKQ